MKSQIATSNEGRGGGRRIFSKLDTMLNAEELYMMNVDTLHDDLYRMGKSSDPNFSEARGPKDCLTYDRNGIRFVVANGNGSNPAYAVKLSQEEITLCPTSPH